MCRSEQPLSSRVPLKPRKCQVEVLMQEKHSDGSCARDCYRPISAAALYIFFSFRVGGAYHLHETFAWPCAACLDSICEEEIKRASFQQLTTAKNGMCPFLNLKGWKEQLHCCIWNCFFFTMRKDFWWFKKKKKKFLNINCQPFALGVFGASGEEFSEGTTDMEIRRESQRSLTSLTFNLELKRLFYIRCR